MDLKAFLQARGYPAEALREPPEVVLNFGLVPEYVKRGLVVWAEGQPKLIIDYAPGAVRSRERGLVAYARLAFPEGPPPLVIQTNEREFVLVEVASGREKAFGGPEILPTFEELTKWSPAPALDPRRRFIEEKILYIHTSGG